VAILGVLASIAMPVIQTSITREKEYQLRIALRDIRTAIDAYKQASANGLIVTSTQSGYPQTLSELAAGVAMKANSSQQMYFLRSVPRDPFFSDETTPAVDTWMLRNYASQPDTFSPPSSASIPDVFDVQSTSSQVGLNGVPYNQW